MPIHVSFVFLLDAITAFLLFGQFHQQGIPLYLVLGGSYLFNAAVSVPFLLAFPGAVQAQGGIIGGPQSAIWLWHDWHILFPSFVMVALVLHCTLTEKSVPDAKLWLFTWVVCTAVLLLVAGITLSVTVTHDQLPVLLDVGSAKPHLTTAFYWAGGTAAMITLLALGMAVWHARHKNLLHLWLAVVLIAYLADVACSLAANARYTVGWYFGRIESIIAASVLLCLFLFEFMRLYRRLGQAVRQLGETNTKLVSLVQENLRATADLEEKNRELALLTKIDYLTQLANRKAIEAHINGLIQEACRYSRPFSVLMLDIDHFKHINDQYGHNAGDQVLVQLSRIIADRIRAADAAGRWGGEEFLVVCTETGLKQAAELAEYLRALIENAPFGLQCSVTASFGVVQYQQPETLTELVLRADKQLYAAKRGGRNRVAGGSCVIV